MKKLTVQDVLLLDPSLDPEKVRRALDELQKPPLSADEIYARDDPGFIAAMLNPPALDRDGLTAPQREVNAFADARGLPIPFPPHPNEGEPHER